MKNILYATGIFDIGDVYLDDQGKLHTVTDVLICYYVKTGTYKVLYEVDNNGEYIALQIRRLSEMTAPQKKYAKPTLQLTPAPKDEPEITNTKDRFGFDSGGE